MGSGSNGLETKLMDLCLCVCVWSVLLFASAAAFVEELDDS